MKRTLLLWGFTAMFGLCQASAWDNPIGIKKSKEPISIASKLRIPRVKSGTSSTDPKRLGEKNPIIPPFTEAFNYREGMEHEDFEKNFQTIDANNDKRVWGMYAYEDEEYSRCAYMHYPLEDMPQADDWLITRAIKLQAGKWYCISLDASLFSDGPAHTFEVKYGMFNDADGLDMPVIPATDVNTKLKKNVKGWICPEFDGIYYIGVHGISTCHSGWLFIDNITIDAPMDGEVPNEITDMKVISSPDGTPSATFTFKAPSKNIANTELSEITAIEVYRGDQLIKTFDKVQPGKEYTFDDTTPKAGYYRYTIQCSNKAGKGAISRHDLFVGMTNPLPPTNVTLTETNSDYATLTWESPATDVNGTAINPDIITYNIYNPDPFGEMVPAEEGVTGNSYQIDTHSEYQQSLVYAAVTAVVNGMESSIAADEVIAVGDPYTLPYADSFVAGSNDYVLAVKNDPGVQWSMLDDHSTPKSQDNDNGYISMIASEPGQKGEIITGKIKLDPDSKTELSFFTYIYEEDENEINVYIIDMETGERNLLATTLLGEIKHQGWKRLNYSLDNYAGKIVRIAIEATIASHGYVPIDNMRIKKVSAINAAVDGVRAPKCAKADEPFEVFATIHNYGFEAIQNYNVVLLHDNKEVATKKGETIARDSSIEIKFQDKLSAISPDMPEITVRVDAEGDTDLEDNMSRPVQIAFIAPVHPVAINLTATENEQGVTLNWDAPDLTKAAPAETLEDFESYAQFATAFGNWSMFDADKGYVGGFKGYDMPGIDGTQQAYWIMSAIEPFDTFIKAHSGINAAVQMYSINESHSNYVQNDDWLISPELYGGKQTIRFWAKSFSTSGGPDVFEVLYSKSDKDITNFETILDETNATEAWTQYFVTIPDGTKYFAVRCTSNNIYMFMVDDFEFIPAGTPTEIKLIGYNVYRNNVKQNTEPLSGTTFTTSRELEADNYFVTAVYDLGESAASNVAMLGEVSIENITADKDSNAPIEYYDLRGIKVNPSDVIPGIYIRRQGSTTTKVVIR